MNYQQHGSSGNGQQSTQPINPLVYSQQNTYTELKSSGYDDDGSHGDIDEEMGGMNDMGIPHKDHNFAHYHWHQRRNYHHTKPQLNYRPPLNQYNNALHTNGFYDHGNAYPVYYSHNPLQSVGYGTFPQNHAYRHQYNNAVLPVDSYAYGQGHPQHQQGHNPYKKHMKPPAKHQQQRPTINPRNYNYNNTLQPGNSDAYDDGYGDQQQQPVSQYKEKKKPLTKHKQKALTTARNGDIPMDQLKEIHDKWYHRSYKPLYRPLKVHKRPRDDLSDTEDYDEKDDKRARDEEYRERDHITVVNLGVYLNNTIAGYNDCIDINKDHGYAKFGCYSRTFIECVCIYFLKDTMEDKSVYHQIEHLANNDENMTKLEFPTEAMHHVRKATNPIVHTVKYGVNAKKRFMEKEDIKAVMKSVADIAIWLEPIIEEQQGK